MTRQYQPQLPFTRPPAPNRRPAPVSLRELEIRASALQGHCLGDIAQALGLALPEDAKRAKGFIGQLVEHALGADPKAGSRPDFPDLGVELKTIPRRPNGSVAESTFCCSVKMDASDKLTWDNSRLKKKLSCVLWVPVEHAASGPLASRRIGRSVLWTPSDEEFNALAMDWEDLMGALGSGQRVDAYAGKWLQLRPKGANAKVRTLGHGEDGAQMVLPLAFYLRARFTQAILNR
jgi:DNA mismatch repair protein MutH